MAFVFKYMYCLPRKYNVYRSVYIFMKAYLRVYNAIREQILNGEAPVGSMLPPEPVLEKQFSVSRTTVRRAMLRLSEEGFIHIKQGRGTEVISSIPASNYYKFHNITGIQEIFNNSGKPFTQNSCYIDQVFADQKIAEALQIPEKTPVYQVQRLLCTDSLPFALMKNYVRTDVAPGLEQYTEELIDLYKLLQEKYNAVFFTGKEHISAATAGFTEAHLLKVAPGTPLLFCTRYAQTHTLPLEYGQTYLRTDRYDLVVEMQGWPAQGVPLHIIR